ncbi:unnamed protein product [Rodentolepis nana]|uniref:RRM domain-containing protein n=1 Tax=Rodentolepis nana TaxID=102285 RepID=A0A0R3T3Z4_RODNA|nr:unnamed protein product [Rodentolepis nana]
MHQPIGVQLVSPFHPAPPSPTLSPPTQPIVFNNWGNLVQLPCPHTQPVGPLSQSPNMYSPLSQPQRCYTYGQNSPWMSFENMSQPPTNQYPLNPSFSYNPSAVQEDSNLFIFHLPATLDEIGLEALFRPFGTIVSTKVFRHHKIGESMGFGFVAFDNSSSAQLAIKCMNGFPIVNKRLFVNLKKSKVEPPIDDQN